MRTVSATEAKQGLAGVLDLAAHEPVVIRRQKRDVAVVLSMKEYERLTRLNVAEFQRFCDAVGDKAMVVADESDAYKNPTAARTKNLMKLKKYCWKQVRFVFLGI